MTSLNETAPRHPSPRSRVTRRSGSGSEMEVRVSSTSCTRSAATPARGSMTEIMVRIMKDMMTCMT